MFVERTSYTPKPGCFEELLAVRHEACRVRLGLGLMAGKVFVEEKDGENIVYWEGTFENREEGALDLKTRDESPAFAAVREKVSRLYSNFSRSFLEQSPIAGVQVRDTSIYDQPVVPVQHTFPSHGLNLAGFLYLPQGQGPFPCLVFNHGSGITQGSQDICRPGLAALFLSWGLAVFMPHRQGYGNSPGRGWREDVPAEYGTQAYDDQLKARLHKESLDVIAAHDYLRTLKEIDADHIGVMGSSFGGVMTLLAAAADQRFRCAVEFAGAAMNWEKAPGLRQFLLDQAVKELIPIYFMQAQNDYTPRPTPELAQAMAGNGTFVRAKVFPGFGLSNDEGHFLCGQGAEVWKKDVRRFLEQWL